MADYIKNRYTLPRSEKVEYFGRTEKINEFVVEQQLYDEKLWDVFVSQFGGGRFDDAAGGWSGEFFGKMMRGACLTYAYTRDEKLYAILERAVGKFLKTQDKLGRFSTYSLEKEFTGWDMWGRKYAMLGLLYFAEISDNKELNAQIISALQKHADYIIANVGKGKKHPIAFAATFWHNAGLPSSSVLEPFVKLYKITGKKEYIDFSKEIIETGFTDNGENLVEVYTAGKRAPSTLKVKKAYEMMSCFQGLLEYYTVVKDEKHLKAVMNFFDSVVENEFSVIGALGIDYEFWGDSKKNQIYTYEREFETCVTVTFMNLCFRLLQLTGECRYADYLERAAQNAMFGAVNTEENATAFKWLSETSKKIETKVFFPFDSYNPVALGRRAVDTAGAMKLTDDGLTYGCCQCIGSMGTAIAALQGVLKCGDEYVLNLYEDARLSLFTPSGKPFELEMHGDFINSDGKADFEFKIEKPERISLKLRIPYWSENTKVVCKGKEYFPEKGTYLALCETFGNGDVIRIEADDKIRTVREGGKIALMTCGIVLARDERYGDGIDDRIEIAVASDGTVDGKAVNTGKFHTVSEFEIPLKEAGKSVLMCDWSSACKNWDKNENLRLNAWF